MRKVDSEIVTKIASAMKVSAVKRTEIVNSANNFTNKNILKNILDILTKPLE